MARLLAPGSDAASAESLVLSVARALPKSPRQVLSLVAETEKNQAGRFTVDRICISPFIEPEPGVLERYLIETEKTLESTDTSDSQLLDTLRLQCLDNIREIICNSKKRDSGIRSNESLQWEEMRGGCYHRRTAGRCLWGAYSPFWLRGPGSPSTSASAVSNRWFSPRERTATLKKRSSRPS